MLFQYKIFIGMTDVRKINEGQNVAISVIKITSIPHLSILCADENWQQANERLSKRYKEDMCGLLYELFQHYKMRIMDFRMEQYDAIELLWLTTPSQGQTYNADISLYIIIRTINGNSSQAVQTVDSLMNICQSALELDKYHFDSVSLDMLCDELSKVNSSSVKAIVRDERIDAINTTALQACYSYDTFCSTEGDFSRIVDILIRHPHAAVSMQLIPAYFSAEEMNELDTKVQILNMLASGVNVQGIGAVQVESAKRAAQTYNYYKMHADQPLFLFNLIVYADGPAALEISAKLMGQLNLGQDTSTALSYKSLGKFDPVQNIALSPWLVQNYIQANLRDSRVWNSGLVTNVSQRLPFIITSWEACEFFRLPIGNENIGAGLPINETGNTSKTYAKGILNNTDLPFGKLKSSPKGDVIGLRLIDLAKHMLIVGTPGSGKTNFSVGLLRNLWLKHKVPFLVIEPAKNEYRALIQNIPELQVFTPGKNTISPFVFNPFVPPENVKLESYKSVLKTGFAAGVTMSSPLDKIFEDTIDNCYGQFKWLNTYTKDDKGEIFNISDFVKCFEETFNEIGYTGDSRNIGRAGLVRLQGLVKLFDNYFSIPIKDLLSYPTVIELAAIENSDEKALYIALILLSVLSYVNANYVGEGDKLRNFILVEEAHVLLDASSNGGEGAANPAAIAQGLVKRMLAEIRSYGVSVAIADQSPRKVGIDIIALTDIKLGFRLVEGEDRNILANSVSMTDRQKARLAKLKPGEAFLFFNKMNEPEEIITPENRNSQGYKVTLSDQEISELSTYWKKRLDKLKPYPNCEKSTSCKETCDYNCRLLCKEISKRIVKRCYKKEMTKLACYQKLRESFNKLLQEELNGEPSSLRVRECTWMHILRNLNYRNFNVGK